MLFYNANTHTHDPIPTSVHVTVIECYSSRADQEQGSQRPNSYAVLGLPNPCTYSGQRSTCRQNTAGRVCFAFVVLNSIAAVKYQHSMACRSNTFQLDCSLECSVDCTMCSDMQLAMTRGDTRRAGRELN